MKQKELDAEYHRRIIGATAPFDLPELRKTYLRIIKENHPDLFYGDSSKYAAATEKTKQLNLSFQFLSEYLEEFGGTYAFVPSSAGQSNHRPDSGRPTYTYEGEHYTAGFPDASVTEIFLKSSHIISTGYDRSKRILYIKFKGNRIYRYSNVPESVFDNFLGAESHGKFAHKNIYHSFEYEKI